MVCLFFGNVIKIVLLYEQLIHQKRLPHGWKLFFWRGEAHLQWKTSLLFFRQNAITILITKNSGGVSTYAKIEAARKLRVPVIMVARPVSSLTEIYPTIDETTDWITKNILS